MKTRKELLEIMKAHSVQMKNAGVRLDDDDGYWVTTEGGHHVHINGEGEPDMGSPYVTNKMGGARRSSPKESKRALQALSDSSGFWCRRSDLEEKLSDSGFSVLESNDEYIVVDDDKSDSDTQFELRLGGTSRSIVIDEIISHTMPDSDDDDDNDDDDDEDDDW